MQEKHCVYTWLVNAKFTSFKLPSFMKLFLIVCLYQMVLQMRLQITLHLLCLLSFTVIYIMLTTLPFPDQSLLPFQGSKKKVSHIPLLSRPTEREFCLLQDFEVCLFVWKLIEFMLWVECECIAFFQAPHQIIFTKYTSWLLHSDRFLILVELNLASYEERRAKVNTSAWRFHWSSPLTIEITYFYWL